MVKTIPFMPFPYKVAKGMIRSFYPLARTLGRSFPSLQEELECTNSIFDKREYLSGVIFTATFYFLVISSIAGIWAYRTEYVQGPEEAVMLIGASLAFSLAIFLYSMIYPKWEYSKRMVNLERNLLFATRHIMVQTAAGVPLFDALVSVSEEYEDENMDYGEIGAEFRKIVKEVRGGKELTQALEESANRNSAPYYRRVVWQMANSHKAGTDIGTSLSHIVKFLSDEERIMIRDYGSQLNPLSLFYMLMCIIMPAMGLIFLMIASTLVEIPINESTFTVLVIALVIMQFMFIGLIKSRRPKVVL